MDFTPSAATTGGRRSWLLFFVWVLAFLGSAPPAGAQNRMVPQACPDDLESQGAVCGTVTVPENYERPDGRSIDLFVVVVRASTPRAGAVPQFDLVGGPGLAATPTVGLYLDESEGTFQLRRERDIVLVDRRGTGRSNPLSCPALEAVHPFDEIYPIEEVRACRDRLASSSDLTRYTTLDAARDMDRVREALGHEQIDLWAVSYGTIQAQVYLRLYPDRVRAAVLVGSSPVDAKFPLFHAAHAQRALDLVFAACEADEACSRAFPDVRLDWVRVLGRLDRGPVRATPPDEWRGLVRREPFGEAFRNLLYSATDQRRLPWMINRAASGDFGPLVNALEPTGGRSSALGLYLSVTCAESTARISLEKARRAAMGTFLGAYRAEAQIAACAEWPQAELPEGFFRPVRSDVPTLLIVGELDAITPPTWSDQVAATLNQARVVRLPHAGHLLWSTGPDGAAGRCADGLTAQFYRTVDVATLNTDCVQALPEPPFFVTN